MHYSSDAKSKNFLVKWLNEVTHTSLLPILFTLSCAFDCPVTTLVEIFYIPVYIMQKRSVVCISGVNALKNIFLLIRNVLISMDLQIAINATNWVPTSLKSESDLHRHLCEIHPDFRFPPNNISKILNLKILIIHI